MVALLAGRACCVAVAQRHPQGRAGLRRPLPGRGFRRRARRGAGAGVRAGRGTDHPAAARLVAECRPCTGAGCRARWRSAPWLPPEWAQRLDYSREGRTLPSAARGTERRKALMCGIVGVVAHTPSTSCCTTACCCCSIAARTPRASSPARARSSTCTRGRDSCRTCSARATCATSWAPPASATAAIRPRARRSPTSSRSRSTSIRRSASRSGHNGNLTNSEELKRELFQLDFRHVNTNSDSEVLLNVLALELERAAQHHRLDPDAIFKAVAGVHKRCRGAYAVVAMIAGYGMLAFRDPLRHPPAHRRQERSDGRHRIHRRVGIGRHRAAGLPRRARRRARRGDLRRQHGHFPRAAMRGASRRSIRASSSSSTSRGPIR